MTKTEDKPIDDLELEEESKDSSAETEPKKKQNKGSLTIGRSKLVLIKKLLDNIKENNENLVQLLSSTVTPEEEERIGIGQIVENDGGQEDIDDTEIPGGRIIEGVFDGENMIGPDGKQYSVPANYASKSKLVEGDILKLTITSGGTFVYKQIGPIERGRHIGMLEQDSNGSFYVEADSKRWRVLTASVTYFKGRDGDETVILVPKTGESKWAAVENVVRKAA